MKLVDLVYSALVYWSGSAERQADRLNALTGVCIEIALLICFTQPQLNQFRLKKIAGVQTILLVLFHIVIHCFINTDIYWHLQAHSCCCFSLCISQYQTLNLTFTGMHTHSFQPLKLNWHQCQPDILPCYIGDRHIAVGNRVGQRCLVAIYSKLPMHFQTKAPMPHLDLRVVTE